MYILLLICVACRSIPEKTDIEEETLDQDGDGFFRGEDCDDANSTIHPAAEEICDGVDNNCNDVIDEEVLLNVFLDTDGDGFGDANAPVEACEAGEGLSLVGNDCDDLNADSYPGAPERCDLLDNDCDGVIDEDLTEQWYADLDQDGYGDPDNVLDQCDPIDGYVGVAEDCDDQDGNINPDALEICDGLDNDCDGLFDDEDADVDYSTAGNYFLDEDGDGHGYELMESDACAPPPGGVIYGDDCDDGNAAIYPGAIEECDLLDNDCDGLIDSEDEDVVGTMTWYFDSDRDGFGDDAETVESCLPVAGYEPVGGDCDDTDASRYPDARETCDNIDEDCDGVIDNGALGSEEICPGESCLDILLDGGDGGDDLYWISPDGNDVFEAWCDMTTDGGGWTRMFGSLYPQFWEGMDFLSYGAPEYDSFSMLGYLDFFADATGGYELRLQVGSTGNWDTDPVAHQTIWQQSHNPISSSSDGSDYVFVSGTEPSTCGGFAGLHDMHYSQGGEYALSTEQASDDLATCWWMQVVPLQQYGSTVVYPGYIDGYDGTHIWQQLWVR